MDAKYILIQTAAGFHFTLNENDEKILGTGEVYPRKATAQSGIQAVRYNSMARKNFELRESVAKEPYFVLKAQNGEIIITSKMFNTKKERREYISATMKCGKTVNIVEKSEVD